MHPEPLSVAKVTGDGGQVWWWVDLPQRWRDPAEASAHPPILHFPLLCSPEVALRERVGVVVFKIMFSK